MYARILAAGAILVLAGCTTPYQPLAFSGGFEDAQLSANTYRVRASGNQYTSPGRVHDIVLLRSSEIALRRGYEYFTMVNGADWVLSIPRGHAGSMRASTEGQPTRLALAMGPGYGHFGNAVDFGPLAGGDGAFALSDTPDRYTTEVVIRLVDKPADAEGAVYDARIIKGSLGQQLE